MIAFLFRTLVVAAGVWAAASLLEGISYTDKTTLFIVAVVLALLNAVLKPLLILFTLPFVVLTMGLGILVINSLLLAFVGSLVPGFEVSSFGTAFLGALVISLTSFLVNLFVGKRSVQVKRGSRRPLAKQSQDVIDV